MNGDLFGGQYTVDEVHKIMGINARPNLVKKPLNPVYRKNDTEHEPSWRQKREFVHWLIHESNISPNAKTYLID